MIHLLFLLMAGPENDVVQSRLDSLLIFNTYKKSIEILKATTEPSDWYTLEDSLGRVAACAFVRLSKFNKQTYEPVEEYNREGMGVAYAYPEPSDAWLNDFRAKKQADTKAQADAAAAKVIADAKAQADAVAAKVVADAKVQADAVAAKVVADTKAQADAVAAKVLIEQKRPAPPQGVESNVVFKVLDSQTHFLVSNSGKTKTPYIEMHYYAKGRVLVKTEKLNPVTLKPLEEPTDNKLPAFIVSTD